MYIYRNPRSWTHKIFKHIRERNKNVVCRILYNSLHVIMTYHIYINIYIFVFFRLLGNFRLKLRKTQAGEPERKTVWRNSEYHTRLFDKPEKEAALFTWPFPKRIRERRPIWPKYPPSENSGPAGRRNAADR